MAQSTSGMRVRDVWMAPSTISTPAARTRTNGNSRSATGTSPLRTTMTNISEGRIARAMATRGIFLPGSLDSDGKAMKPRNIANPRWIARASASLTMKKLSMKGSGEAYQSWNSDQASAT